MKLKNEDAIIGIVFANCKLSVQCLRLMEFTEDYGDEGPLCLHYMPKKNDLKKMGYRVHIEESFTALGLDMEDVSSLEIVESHLDSSIEWIGSHKAPKFFWGSLYTSATGYFGNEASETDFYTYAAITATVPPYEERCEEFEPVALTEEQLAAKKTPAKKTPAKKAPAKKAPAKKAANTGTKLAGRKRKQPDTPIEDTKPKKVAKTASTPEPGSQPSATPVLYESTPKQAATSGKRTIHVIGGKGGLANRCDGKVSVTLAPGHGLKELKKALRNQFGKVPSMRMSSLVVVNEDGSTGAAVATKDLVDGMKLQCTYTYAPGNPQSLRPYTSRGYGRRGDDCIIS